MVPPAGVEPAAFPLGEGRSIHLSYGGKEGPVGLEPTTGEL